ncbi:MAG: ATP-grasp domain-containing protein, partial [Treponema sp.]|nr:ATP-grasp domain-containing protein [Treponema sp.]
IVAWARSERPDLVVVGPEAPLVAGLVDALEAEGVRAFGPVAAGARIEGSKRFAKEVMNAAGVPTGMARTFTDAAEAKAALAEFGRPVVVKADGLAAGKGVVVAETAEQAEAAIDDMLVVGRFGKAGAEVLVEEFLDGEECSILAMVDGERAVLLPGSQDHKRVVLQGRRFQLLDEGTDRRQDRNAFVRHKEAAQLFVRLIRIKGRQICLTRKKADVRPAEPGGFRKKKFCCFLGSTHALILAAFRRLCNQSRPLDHPRDRPLDRFLNVLWTAPAYQSHVPWTSPARERNSGGSVPPHAGHS